MSDKFFCMRRDVCLQEVNENNVSLETVPLKIADLLVIGVGEWPWILRPEVFVDGVLSGSSAR